MGDHTGSIEMGKPTRASELRLLEAAVTWTLANQSDLIECPAKDCHDELPAHDLAAQSRHMVTCHPDIVARERLEDGEGWD